MIFTRRTIAFLFGILLIESARASDLAFAAPTSFSELIPYLVVSLFGLVLLFFVIRNILQIRHAENKAEGIEHYMELLLDASINEIYIFDVDSYRFINVSKGALDNLGYSHDEVLELTAYNIKPEFDLSSFEKAISPLKKGEKELLVFETIHRRKDGSTYPVEVHLQLMKPPGQPEQFMAVILDITERKNAEQALIKSETHFRTLLESTSAIPWEVDLSTWRFTYVGPQIEQVSGYSQQEWYQPDFWSTHLHPADRDRAVMFCKESTEKCEDHEFEYRFITKQGKTIWIRDSVQVVVEDNKPAMLRGFMFDITHNKEVQAQQEKIHHRLVETQGIAHIGSWEFDPRNDEIIWSDETYRIFGLEPNEAIKMDKYISVIHPGDRSHFQQVYQDAVENRHGYEIEHRLLMKDGSIKYVYGRGNLQLDSQGEVVRVFGTVQDITERKRTDEAMKTVAAAVSSTGDSFYQQLVTSMAEMFDADYAFIGLLSENRPMVVDTYMVYAHGKIVNNFSYELKGTPCMNVVGKEVCAYPDHVQQLFPHDKLLTEMGVESYIGVPLFASGGYGIGLVTVMDSKPMKNVAHMEEVLTIFAARTEAELERKKANETIQKLSMAVEQSPNTIIITDVDGNIEYVNPAFVETTGYSTKEVLHKTPAILKSGIMPDSFYEELWQTISSGKPWSGTFHNRRSDGELYWGESRISPIKNARGEITHYLCLQSDITEQKQMELQLRRSQKMDALGKLTGGIAHDYNNMLNVILGYTELLEMVVEASGDDKQMEYIHEIHRATERGSTLTKKLLSFSRQEPAEPVEVDLNAVLSESEDMLKKTLTARIQLHYQLQENTWPVYFDRNEFEDALLNMCINAMHAMPEGGELSITTSNVELLQNEANILGLQMGDYVLFTLADTGCGIDEELLAQIFDPFFTTKGEMGTGLGLTQVYGFVKRAKGAIRIDSKINEGTYIQIYFPRYQDGHAIKESATTRDVPLTGTETILVVDDEQAICELAKNMLESKGYQVVTADSGEAALKVLDRKPDIDLLLTDIIMPGMDGYKLAEKVRKKYPMVKIQLMSGYDDDRKRTEDDEVLYQNVLHKPYTANKLYAAVRRALDAKPA